MVPCKSTKCSNGVVLEKSRGRVSGSARSCVVTLPTRYDRVGAVPSIICRSVCVFGRLQQCDEVELRPTVSMLPSVQFFFAQLFATVQQAFKSVPNKMQVLEERLVLSPL